MIHDKTAHESYENVCQDCNAILEQGMKICDLCGSKRTTTMKVTWTPIKTEPLISIVDDIVRNDTT